MAELLIELRVEEIVFLHVGGNVRRAGLVDLPDDSEFGGEPLADQIAAGVAEGGNEDQLVLAANGHFAEGVVEQDRSRFRRHELVRLLQDLAEDEVEVDVALERKPRFLPLQKTFQLRDFERVELHRQVVREAPIIRFARLQLLLSRRSARKASASNEIARYAASWVIPRRLFLTYSAT